MKKLILTATLVVSAMIGTAQNIPCPDFVCQNDVNLTTYTVPATAGSTYQWAITGGVIVAGQGTNTIQVNWAATAAGVYNVSVTETTAANCPGTPVTCTVTVTPTPATGAITHD
jgi:phenolic acid decarboxylase